MNCKKSCYAFLSSVLAREEAMSMISAPNGGTCSTAARVIANGVCKVLEGVHNKAVCRASCNMPCKVRGLDVPSLDGARDMCVSVAKTGA